MPALLNFEKERANLTYLNEERIKLKEQIDVLQKEIAYFRNESQLGKVSCASQTNENNTDVQDNSKYLLFSVFLLKISQSCILQIPS